MLGKLCMLITLLKDYRYQANKGAVRQYQEDNSYQPGSLRQIQSMGRQYILQLCRRKILQGIVLRWCYHQCNSSLDHTQHTQID